MKHFQNRINYDKDENYKIISDDLYRNEYLVMMIMKLQIILIKRLNLKKMQTFVKRQETKMTQDKT